MLSNFRLRVLCVDDDEDSRVMLPALLKLALIEAKAVGTAAQAWSSIQTERFDLYFLDARLPDLDGFELCRRMRVFDQWKSSEPQAEVEFAVDPNRWFTAVQAWVSEFQQHRHGESPPAFDSLFKDAQLQ